MTDCTKRAAPVALLLLALLAPGALAAPAAVTVRVEGTGKTTFEGPVTTDGHQVTTASGGTFKCDGTNGGRPGAPGPTATSALDDASRVGGFTWDATFFNDPAFEEFFISRIGPDSQTNTQFWWLGVNGRESNTGGCQARVRAGDEVLWACASSSSRSIHWWGMRLRARNSRSRRESGENREPISLIPVSASIRNARRAMNAPRMMSLRPLSSATSSRSFSTGTWITSPPSLTTPLR